MNKELEGKVVTIRSIAGDEYIAKYVSETKTVLTVEEPRVVVINDNNIALIPYALTAATDTVEFNRSLIMAVMPTIEGTADDYVAMIEAQRPAEPEMVEAEPV